MKARKKLDRIFALLLVFTLIFNSQATALLAMEGEPVTEIAGSEVTPLSGTEGEQEIIDDNTVVIPDGEAAGDPAESVTQPEAAQGGDLVLDEESVPGSDSTSGQGDDSSTGQENAGENVAGTQELEPEPESKTEQPADAEPEIGQADPSISEPENEQTAPSGSEPEAGQETLSGSATEDGTGADEESGPAVDVESDSDIIVEEETEPQTLEQGADTLEPVEDEAETEAEYEAEVMAMGLDDEIMLTATDGELPELPEGFLQWNDVTCDECKEEYIDYVNEAEGIEEDIYYPEVQIFDSEGNPLGWHYLHHAVEKVDNGQTIKLFDDLDYWGGAYGNYNIELGGKSITLDLNDLSLYSESGKPNITVTGEGSLTIQNGSFSNTRYTNSQAGYSAACIHAKNADIVLENVAFSSGKRKGNGGGIIYQNGGTLTMNDVSVNGTPIQISACDDGGAWFMYVDDCDRVSMNTVKVTGQGASGSKKYSAAYFTSCTEVEITGLNFEGGTGGDYDSNENKDAVLRFDKCGDVSIKNSKFTDIRSANAVICALNGSNVNLSGSTLSNNHSGLGSVYVGDKGTITITGTTIKGETISNGLYIANGGKATMTSGALYGSGKGSVDDIDVTIEQGATANILAVSEMEFPEEEKIEYNAWIGHTEEMANQSGMLNFEKADKKYQYKAGEVLSYEAQIIRDKETPKSFKTLANAVAASIDGDVIQLLPDTLTGAPVNRTIEVKDPIDLIASVTIDLNNQTLKLSTEYTDSAHRATIRIPDEKSLTVTGSGEMIGGYDNFSTELNETISVGTKKDSEASLTITGGAHIKGVKNYGTVKLEQNAQVDQIAQFSGTFTLDTVLKSPLEVVLDFATYNSKSLDESTYENTTWLKTGKKFEIQKDAKINIGLSASERLSFGETLFAKWLEGDGVSNSLKLIEGTKIEDLVDITTISLDSAITGKAVLTASEDKKALILLRTEGTIYLGGENANDENSGYTKGSPVASMEKAIELAQDVGKKIYLVGTVHVTANQTWYLPADFSFNYEACVGKKPLAIVETGGNLTLKSIELKGAGIKTPSNYPLIQVESGGNLFIEESVVLSGNYHSSNGGAVYNNGGNVKITGGLIENCKATNGGAVYNKGGSLEMTGGTIKNCEATNGGAVYCEGGDFAMSGGLLGGSTLSDANSAKGSGGAVMLANGAHMTLSGEAVISYNSARENEGEGYGGGIAVGGYYADTVNVSPTLTMTGGTVQGNVAKQYGGGIFVQCNAKANISGGKISSNIVNLGAYGGGGIYVNGGKNGVMYGGQTMTGERSGYENGVLTLTNAVIRNNTASEGGGIAGCPTSSVKILPVDGAAVYGNTGKNKESDDIYIATELDGSSIKGVFADVFISHYMSDGTPYQWKDKDGNYVMMNELNKNTKNYLFAKAQLEHKLGISLHTEASPKDTSKAAVYIENNESDTKGGGIGTNGTVIIGNSPTSITVTARKVWDEKGRAEEKIERPAQIEVWLLRKPKGADDSAYERVAVESLKPDAEGNWGSVTFADQPTSLNEVDYEYTVKEDTSNLSDVYKVTVAADTEAESDNNWVITNTYTPTGTATVSATKKLTGRAKALEDDEFSFSLTKVSALDKDNKPITDSNADQTKTNTGEAVNFDTLNYTQAGTYTYTLKEEETDKGGITKDSTVYTVTVKMEDDDAGHLIPTVTYKKGNDEVPAAEVVFTNQYTATGTATVSATKKLNGRAKTLENGEFSFSLTKVSAVDKDDKSITDPNANQTKTNTGEAVNFDTLNYTQAGTYTYTLKEEETDKGGIKKDPTVYTVTVKMEDDDAGHLTPTVTYKKGDKEVSAAEVVFTNQYTATGTATVSVTKKLNGRAKALEDGEFSFSLTKVSALDKDNKPITDSNADQTKTNKGEAINFDTLNYTQVGTYTYTLKEEETDKGGITKDSTVYTVTVEMEDDDAGHLTPTVTYKKGDKEVSAAEVVFTNQYTATGTATVSATKKLNGRAKALEDGEFSFSLTKVSALDKDNKPITDSNADQTKTNKGEAINFDTLNYTQAGTYTYTLKEEETDKGGIKKDPTVYTVIVEMEDNDEGHLTQTVTYKKGDAEVSAEDVIFTNQYTAIGTATVSATKKLTGRANGLQDKEFSFSLTPVSAVAADGKTEITDPNTDAETNPGGMLTASNDGNGNVTFEKLTYTQAGTYTYELKEENTAEAGITKDPSVYTVTVSVTDDGLGNLHADVKYSKDGKEVAAADVAFENVYDAEDTSIRLGATKAFDRELEGNEFTFALREVDQNGHAVEGGISREAVNGKDGSVLFDPIPYDKEGTYYYQISETAGNDPTVLAYDAAVYTVTVTVKDVDAKLVATAVSPDKVTFTNTSTKAYLDKQDAETGAGIPGAVLRIVDKSNGAVVEEWTSDGKPHEVLGKLSKNGSYALEEVSAPDGYMPTGPADFTMNEKGEIVVGGQITDTVVMKDTKNTISLLKLDEAGQPLPGAHLVIEDATGTAVDNWVSDGTPHVTRGLARGHYVMSEVEAPAGYHVSEDVPFEITGNETQPVEVQMTDTKIPERDNNKLTVMKHLQLDGITCDIGIHDAVFYVALFDDEAKTHRVSDVKALTFKDSAISTAEFENLGKGTYYLGETDENGVLKESEVVNDRVIYYAQYGENAKVEFEGRKGEATSELTNVYVEVPEEGFYLSGRLTITKKVLLNGTEATSEDTFYARVFSDAALTSPNSDVVALAMNGGSTASVTVYDLPIGETLESSATYYVAETDKNGTPLDPDAVTEYRISIDKSGIVLNAENSNQEVTITNDFIEEEDETETETDLPDEPGTAPGSGTSASKTGDETNLLLYLFYMMLSAGLFAAAAGEKRRRRNRVKK